MLMVPLLDQGGLERICAMTAKLLTPHCHLTLVVFSTKGMIYDVEGVDMIDLNLGSVPGKVGKAVNLCKRIRAIKKIKRIGNPTYKSCISIYLPKVFLTLLIVIYKIIISFYVFPYQ